MSKNIAVITGASSGIGRAFARKIPDFYRNLDELWLVARNEAELRKTAEGCRIPARIIAADLLADGSSVLETMLRAEKPRVCLLINSAGCAERGSFDEMEQTDIQRQLDLNCCALTITTHSVLPYIPRRGRILMLASGAAFSPQPGQAVYAASKAYVLSFSAALGEEQKKAGISVTAVCPGPVDTPLLRHLYGGKKPGFLRRLTCVSPEQVAGKALKDSAKNKSLSICGAGMKISYVLCRCIPQKLLFSCMRLFGISK